VIVFENGPFLSPFKRWLVPYLKGDISLITGKPFLLPLAQPVEYSSCLAGFAPFGYISASSQEFSISPRLQINEPASHELRVVYIAYDFIVNQKSLIPCLF
jgi:hypothetical protein